LADTTEREDMGWKQAQRQGEHRVNLLIITVPSDISIRDGKLRTKLGMTLWITLSMIKFAKILPIKQKGACTSSKVPIIHFSVHT
jgi:hypothetical protein